MSKQVALAAQSRESSGKGAASRLRSTGRVPAVAYGSGLEATALSVDALELYHVLHTDAGLNAVIRLEVEGETHLAMAREIQRHPVRRDILHVDFVTVDRHAKVNVDVPIILEGDAPGADAGGVVDQQLHALAVSVLPLEVPDQLFLDVSGLEVGDIRRVADIPLPEGVETTEDPERTVVIVSVPTFEVPEDEAAEGEEAADGEEAAEGEAAEDGEGAAAEAGEDAGA